VLIEALQDKTDEEIAHAIGTTAEVVKKRWKTIYERVSDVDPTLVPASPERRRGEEKRRHLVAYLRDHYEELRPLARNPRRGG